MQLSGDSLSSDPRSSRNTMLYALGRQGAGGDLFAVDPIRCSAGAIVVCAALIALPLLVLHGDTQRAVGLLTSWIGLTGLILCIPILSISLLEEGWQRPQRRIWPTIDQLELPPRPQFLAAARLRDDRQRRGSPGCGPDPLIEHGCARLARDSPRDQPLALSALAGARLSRRAVGSMFTDYP
jgi:hypothetical protein